MFAEDFEEFSYANGRYWASSLDKTATLNEIFENVEVMFENGALVGLEFTMVNSKMTVTIKNVGGVELVIPKEYGLAVESFTLNKTKMTLTVGETDTLTVENIQPQGAEYDTVYRAENTCVSVDENGLVTAIAAGIARIEVTIDNVTLYCDVTVNQPLVAVEEKLYDFSKATFVQDDILAENTTFDALTVTPDAKFKVTDKTCKMDGENIPFHMAWQLGKKGSYSNKSVQFIVTEPGTVRVYYSLASTGVTSATLTYGTENSPQFVEIIRDDNVSTVMFVDLSFNQAGTYAIWESGEISSINIYGIKGKLLTPDNKPSVGQSVVNTLANKTFAYSEIINKDCNVANLNNMKAQFDGSTIAFTDKTFVISYTNDNIVQSGTYEVTAQDSVVLTVTEMITNGNKTQINDIINATFDDTSLSLLSEGGEGFNAIIVYTVK